jgi:hypothetical protein
MRTISIRQLMRYRVDTTPSRSSIRLPHVTKSESVQHPGLLLLKKVYDR